MAQARPPVQPMDQVGGIRLVLLVLPAPGAQAQIAGPGSPGGHLDASNLPGSYKATFMKAESTILALLGPVGCRAASGKVTDAVSWDYFVAEFILSLSKGSSQ